MSAVPLPPPAAPDVAVTLARIEVKLDGALHAQNDHEKRLRRLEAGDGAAARARRAAQSLWVASFAAAASAGSLVVALSR